MQNKITWSVIIAAAVLMFTAGRAAAFPNFTQNEFMTAGSLDPGMTQAGINFSLDRHIKSYYPEIRYGVGGLIELGVKFGATSVDVESVDKVGPLVGLDIKYQLIKETEGVPLDLAVDLALNNTIISRKNATEVTFATIASRDFPLTDRGYKIIPYGGLAMSSLSGALPDKQKTFMNVFAGLEWKLSQKFMVLLEIKGGDPTMGGLGIRFEY